MTLMMYTHGGHCCGITQLYGFPIGCESLKENNGKGPTEAKLTPEILNDLYKDFQRTTQKGFVLPYCDGETTINSVPWEPFLDRLDRFISYARQSRPGGVIEAVLAEVNWGTPAYNSSYTQHGWGPALEERGFRLVTSAKNTNSKNIIHIYHLDTNL